MLKQSANIGCPLVAVGGIAPKSSVVNTRRRLTSDLPAHLLAVCRGRAEDGQLGPAGFGFGRLAGVEKGLDEGLQVLSLLETMRAETLACLDQPSGPDGRRRRLTSFISFPGTDLKIFPVKQQKTAERL